MRELLSGGDYVPLSVEPYFAEFWERFKRLDDVLWKLERRQDFREPGYPSWDAFAVGNVDQSLALIEEGRGELLDYHQKMAARGVVSRRVRIVTEPPTPYLWWESHVLKIRAEAGEEIRTLDVASVAEHEDGGWTLPELMILGTEATVRATRSGPRPPPRTAPVGPEEPPGPRWPDHPRRSSRRGRLLSGPGRARSAVAATRPMPARTRWPAPSRPRGRPADERQRDRPRHDHRR